MSRVGRTNSQRHLSSSTFCRLTSCLQLEEELFQSHRSVAADTSGTLELPGNGSLPLAALACRLCPLLGSRLESGTAHSQALLAPTLQLVPKGNCSQQAPTLLGFCILSLEILSKNHNCTAKRGCKIEKFNSPTVTNLFCVLLFQIVCLSFVDVHCLSSVVNNPPLPDRTKHLTCKQICS